MSVPDTHHRKSIRIKRYDYSQDGAYFVTICAQDRQCLFGDIVEGKIALNEAGKMVDRWWRKLFQKYPDLELDKYVIMPNHIHGIIVIRSVGAIPRNRPAFRPASNATDQNTKGENMVSPLRIQNTYDGLGRCVSWFKRMAFNEYVWNVKSGKLPPFEKSIWQRNYYERIIRDDNELNQIREYIANNPINWETDELFH